MIRKFATLSLLLLGACATRSPALRPTGAFAPDSTHTAELASGVSYTRMHIPSGPWLVYVVTVAPAARAVDFQTVKGLGHVVGRERPSAAASRTAVAERRPVLAAVNADFFNFQPPGVSEGPQVSAGRVVKSEDTHRAAVSDTVLREQPTFGVDGGGKPFFADAHLDGWVRVGGGEPVALSRVNTSAASDSIVLYSSYLGARTPVDTGVVEVVVRTVRTAAMAGDTAVGVVLRVDSAADGVDIPSDGMVLAERVGSASGMSPQPGDSVWWSLRFRGAPARVRELVGGFPMLLRHDTPVFGQIDDMIPGFSEKEHPRTAVGLRRDGTVLLVAVDGRREDSRGMSLAELTRFMQALGATDALNLDGGESTTLAIDGKVVNHPSDKEGERAVSNALLLLGP